VATRLKNLSEHDRAKVPSAAGLRFAIVVSEWNTKVTEALCNGAIKTLIESGAKPKHIVRRDVPGSFELTLGARLLLDTGEFDAVICLGCVIQGETRHFEFICNAVAQGITDLNVKYGVPVVFGVLTPDTLQQALDRAGGKHGNKGDEAAFTAIRMAHLRSSLRKKS
jgi:6,7-dimethyl-8-ribityllumazine synthase